MKEELPPGVHRLAPARLAWTCPARLLRPALQADVRVAEAEGEELVRRVADPARRARIQARRRLVERPPAGLDEIVGQERAVEAITAGLTMEAPAFHVFVCAPPGTGRRALVRGALERHLPPLPAARDAVHVADFAHPDRPRLLTFPRGVGSAFRADLDEVLAVLRRAIPAALGHEEHLARVERIRRRWEGRAFRLIEELALRLRQQGLVVGQIPEGFATPELRIDLGDRGEPLTARALERRLARGELRHGKQLAARLAAEAEASRALAEVAREARELVRRGALRVKQLEARIARSLARSLAEDLARRYPTRAARRWLRSLVDAVGERADQLAEPPPRHDHGAREDERRPDPPDPLAAFRANLFLDASERPAHPILFEPAPTLQNLFGSVDPGELPADHLRLRAGSLARANGGVLVLDAQELWSDPQAWRALVRAVSSGWLELAPPPPGQGPGSALRPQPLRTAFKLVAIGTDAQWEQMLHEDAAFPEVFKVKVQLEDLIERSDANVTAAAGVLLRLARRAGLLRPDAGALARLLEHAARRAGQRGRLAAGFSELLDALQEADRLARARPGARALRRAHVDEALARRRRRHDLLERRTQEDLQEGLIVVETAGARVGVVNALVVYDTGDHVFSHPARITAAVSVGRRGVLDLEREAELSGALHHKGVQVLSGLVRGLYAQDQPLGLTASLCFEQSHGVVDGDSASAAEALALISALADLPCRQDWALTGAVTQLGELCAVGDVTPKVEGFFALCRARGLTGRQGVLIPRSSAEDLALVPEVVAAVRAGKFHVVTAATLDQALALFLGHPAGTRARPGAPWSPGSVHARAQERLRGFAAADAREPRGSLQDA